MNRYLQTTLHVNEEVLIQPKLHWAVYFDNYFSLAVLYVLLCESMNFFIENSYQFYPFFAKTEKYIGIAILLRIIYLFIRNYSIEMAVTNYRVIFKIGIIHIDSEELSNDKVETVRVCQSFIGRILNYGNIIFSGTGTSRLVFKKVFAPWWVKSKIEDIMRQIAIRRHDRFYSNDYAQHPDNYNHQGYNEQAYHNPYDNRDYSNFSYNNNAPYPNDPSFTQRRQNMPYNNNPQYNNNPSYGNNQYEDDYHHDDNYDDYQNSYKRY